MLVTDPYACFLLFVYMLNGDPDGNKSLDFLISQAYPPGDARTKIIVGYHLTMRFSSVQ